jgi:dTDP-4-dehydrorhamnose reductase
MNRLRIAVTGTKGQVVLSLAERGSEAGVEIIPRGRPVLDFDQPADIQKVLESARPDVIVNAAAYTAVDQAEHEETVAFRHNCEGAAEVARAAASLKVPMIHLSTDYVFDGELSQPYGEEDAANPTGVYGRSKWAGEKAIAAITRNHVILRTAWVYSPFGRNFVKTMLNLGLSRDEISVVADQTGNPTSALDIADAVLNIAQSLHAHPEAHKLRGLFHLTGQGAATWADMAEAVFEEASLAGRKAVSVKRITTADYPTPARRPQNSRLDNHKLKECYGLQMPAWRSSLKHCVQRLLAETEQKGL